MNALRNITVDMLDVQWDCEVEVFDDEAIITEVKVAGIKMPFSAFDKKFLKVLESFCLSAAWREAA